MSEEYKRGYREGYKDGMAMARELYGPLLPIMPRIPEILTTKCSVCDIEFNGPMGYVCTHPKCPSRVVW